MSNNRNQRYRYLIAIFLVLPILGFSPGDTYAKTIIRFATLAPEGSAWMKAIRALDQEVRDSTGGDVQFKLYPNMAMGDEKDVLRKIRLGQINGAGFTGVGLGEIDPELRILELPYLFDTEQELDYVTDQLTTYFSDRLKDKGFVLLGWADVGWVYFLSKKPVADPSQLDGVKVWMWEGDPLAEAFFEELHKAPVQLPITDVHFSLQTGLIDAVYCSPLAALALQWYTKTEYISDIPFTNAIGAVLIDKGTFDKISPDNQRILLDLSRKQLRELLVQSRKDNAESYQVMLQQGLKAAPSTQAQRDQMRTVGERVQQRLTGSLYSQELLDRLKGLISEYRASHPGKK